MTTLREEKSGKREASASSILRLRHLQKLAKCAGVPPPLAALFGHHLAYSAEAAGVPLDSSWFLCQRSDLFFRRLCFFTFYYDDGTANNLLLYLLFYKTRIFFNNVLPN